jgi:hypothetical protein
MKLWKKILLGIAAVVFLAGVIFVLWGLSASQPLPEAIQALKSDDSVTVKTGDWLVFSPAKETTTTGFIFYPGGKVDYRAYAPMAHQLAAQGILVVIPKMPLNLAVFGINQAEGILSAYPEIQTWYIGGHSLGGSMAADYLYKHPGTFDGLVFLASYPASSDPLKDYPGKVLSISASNDGLATPDKIEASRAILPASTTFYVVEGGNHAYFGWYGDQKGDNAATISREYQQKQVILQISEFMK